jgi:hypothetical protein
VAGNNWRDSHLATHDNNIELGVERILLGIVLLVWGVLIFVNINYSLQNELLTLINTDLISYYRLGAILLIGAGIYLKYRGIKLLT